MNSMSDISVKIADLVKILPEEDQTLVFEIVKRFVLANYPHYSFQELQDHRLLEWQVKAVEPHEDYTLTVAFRYGDKRLYNMRPLIDGEKAFKPYAPLKDLDFFMRAYVDGSVAWSDQIDIAPEELYYNGKPIV